MALPKLIPNPGQQPALSPMPVPARRRSRWLFAILLAAGMLVAAWYLRPRPLENANSAPAVRLARVIRGNLQRTVRLSGSIGTKNFTTIAAPIIQSPDTGRGRVLIYLPPSGSD